MLTVYNTDALSALAQIEDESVQCCVTSPPYWGLRDYGIEPSIWDANDGCEHVWGDTITVNATNHTDKRRWNHTRNGRDEEQPIEKRVAWLRTVVDQGNICQTCGAWRGCFGLEPTPELYVHHSVNIFREVRRVLRGDGTLWLNLGDSYATGAGKVGEHPGGGKQGAKYRGDHGRDPKSAGIGPQTQPNRMPIAGLKSKDLVGIPWMVAFALRADGWYLRSDIIWSKPAPMPESVTDRPTKSHEYIFLLTKSQRYYYDHEAIKEPAVATHGSGNGYKRDARLSYGGRGSDQPYTVRSKRDSFKRENSKREQAIPGQSMGTHRPNRAESEWDTQMRNKRSVWTVNTRPFNDAHFATFPPELITPCVLAGCPREGVVLDVCAGSGTVGKVAIELGRKAVLIEPNPDYCKMIEQRTTTTIGLPFHSCS